MTDPRDRDHEESGEYATLAQSMSSPNTPPSTTEASGPASCSTPRWPVDRATRCAVIDERHRVRLIQDLSKLLHDPCCPESAKTAGLTLIGWLARRLPGEEAHGYGVAEAQRATSRQRTRRAR